MQICLSQSVASHGKSMQVDTRPGQMELYIDKSFRLVSICESVCPGLQFGKYRKWQGQNLKVLNAVHVLEPFPSLFACFFVIWVWFLYWQPLKPGEKRQWEDWEEPWYRWWALILVAIPVLFYYKPETRWDKPSLTTFLTLPLPLPLRWLLFRLGKVTAHM